MAGGANPAAQVAPQGQNVFQGAANALGSATQAAQGAAGYQPPSLGGRSLNRYQNPYQQQVIDTTLGDIDRQRQMAINDVGSQFGGAGAFGGSRHGIAEAETNRAAMDAAAQASGQLRSQGFMNAQGMANQDIQNQMAARQMGLGAASQLGNLSNLGFGQGQAINQMQGQQGLQQQASMQALIDAANQQYAGFTGSPAASTQAPLQALGTVPYGQTSTTTQNPGLFDYLSLGASIL